MSTTNACNVPDVNASSQIVGATVTKSPKVVPVTVTSPPAVLLEFVHFMLVEATSTKSMPADRFDKTPMMAVLLAVVETLPMVKELDTNTSRQAAPLPPRSRVLLLLAVGYKPPVVLTPSI